MPMTYYPGADEGEPVGHHQEDAEARRDRLLDLERRCADIERKIDRLAETVEAIEQHVYGSRDIAAEVADYLEITKDEVMRMFRAAVRASKQEGR
jgi:hypothetical protein